MASSGSPPAPPPCFNRSRRSSFPLPFPTLCRSDPPPPLAPLAPPAAPAVDGRLGHLLLLLPLPPVPRRCSCAAIVARRGGTAIEKVELGTVDSGTMMPASPPPPLPPLPPPPPPPPLFLPSTVEPKSDGWGMLECDLLSPSPPSAPPPPSRLCPPTLCSPPPPRAAAEVRGAVLDPHPVLCPVRPRRSKDTADADGPPPSPPPLRDSMPAEAEWGRMFPRLFAPATPRCGPACPYLSSKTCRPPALATCAALPPPISPNAPSPAPPGRESMPETEPYVTDRCRVL